MNNVSLLNCPYPYRSMLAICSDLDETESAEVYFNTLEYLNTQRETPFGKGVGLETGNSMYFYMLPDQFAYWNTDDYQRARARDLMRSGHIDCFHSFGDIAHKRSEAEFTLDHLKSHDCKMRTWIDHAVAPSNFGADIMQGLGDIPSSDIYHADMTLAFGVEYVWIGTRDKHARSGCVAIVFRHPEQFQSRKKHEDPGQGNCQGWARKKLAITSIYFMPGIALRVNRNSATGRTSRNLCVVTRITRVCPSATPRGDWGRHCPSVSSII